MEIDKAERFLGISPNTGRDKAIDWINSTDKSLCLKGIAVLADIGDKESVDALRHTTEDPDDLVAIHAKFAMDKLMRK